MDNFCAFILTHGRPDNVRTYNKLREYGYSGRIVLLVDDKDESLTEYINRYGDEVYVFSKSEVAKTFDQGNNFNDPRSVIYARNANPEIARELGVTHYIQLDDDYTGFWWRFNPDRSYHGAVKVRRLDDVFEAMVTFIRETPYRSIAMAQGGDYIGGSESTSAKAIMLKRKVMNSFVVSTDNPMEFVSILNDDVTTYVVDATRGVLYGTTNYLSLDQSDTQQQSGGLTELYLDTGTYVKSFYSVMFSPSNVSIISMGSGHRRLHHRVSWKNTTPMILREEHKK